MIITCGLDASTNIVGWAFAEDKSVLDAGFLNISKLTTNKEKAKLVVNFLSNHPLISKVDHLNLEASLSGFGGLNSQKILIMLSRWNAVLEYVLSEFFKFPINLCNVHTMRKKVLGVAHIKGVKPKIFVKEKLPIIVPNIIKFEKLNIKKEWDAHNSDTYDAIVCSLFG